MKMHWTAWLFWGAILAAPAAAQEKLPYKIDAPKSKLELKVYREGALKFLGHDHLVAVPGVSGTVQLDPANIARSSVSLKVETKSLRVLDPGVSEKDRREVQATMEGEKVLDVARYPEITITSTGVSEVKPAGGGYELTLTGELCLHGVVKTIRLPVRMRAEGGELRVQGETLLRQTDYQMTPVRVGGGAVKVKDQLKISFEIVAVK
jgi:polyisoprenoid-binding protein YceI